jgi:hypothetical protein
MGTDRQNTVLEDKIGPGVPPNANQADLPAMPSHAHRVKK